MWLKVGYLLDDISESLSSLSGEARPLLLILELIFWDALEPDNGGVYHSTCHVEEVQLRMLPHFVRGTPVVPAEHMKVVDGTVDFALVRPHVEELINNGDL